MDQAKLLVVAAGTENSRLLAAATENTGAMLVLKVCLGGNPCPIPFAIIKSYARNKTMAVIGVSNSSLPKVELVAAEGALRHNVPFGFVLHDKRCIAVLRTFPKYIRAAAAFCVACYGGARKETLAAVFPNSKTKFACVDGLESAAQIMFVAHALKNQFLATAPGPGWFRVPEGARIVHVG